MKLYVFSDSHGHLQPMLDVIEEHSPDAVIFLGDGLEDAQQITYIFPELPLYMVPGNCDGFTDISPIQEIIVGEVRILFSHGHLWSVKRSDEQARELARDYGAQILLYGHTHIPLSEEDGDLWIMNPGAARCGYGVIHVEEDSTFHCELKTLPYRSIL